MTTTDPLNLQVIKDRIRKRNTIQGPRSGDFVIMPDRTVERLTGRLSEYSSWVNSHKTFPIDGVLDPRNRHMVRHPCFSTDREGTGSFYLRRDGTADHSGGNDFHNVSRRAKLVNTGQTK